MSPRLEKLCKDELELSELSCCDGKMLAKERTEQHVQLVITQDPPAREIFLEISRTSGLLWHSSP